MHWVANVTVTVPDDLLAEARRRELNLSAALREALSAELQRLTLAEWIAACPTSPITTSDQVLAALDNERADADLYTSQHALRLGAR